MAETAEQVYLFQAMRPTGGKTLGMRGAENESALSEILRRDELLLLRAWRLPVGASSSQRIPLKDQAALNEQIQALLARGVPLVEALEVASTVVSNKSRLRIDRLRELVAAGSSFSGACEKVGGFDVATIAVYRSAEQSGDLAPAAQRLAQAARRQLTISGKAVTVMIYPMVVLCIAVALLSGLLVYVVPMLAEQIRAINSDLPWFSDIVFSFGTWIRDHGSFVLIGLGIALVSCIVGWRYVARFLSAAARKIPGMKGLLLTVEMSRFFSVMAAMTRSGVPLAEALSASTGVISDKRLREQLDWLRSSLVEGGVLRMLIERVDALPLATRRLLIAAERAGDLDSAFDALADEMSKEVDLRASRLLALLEPMVIVGMFLLLAPLIIAIAIPMMTVQTDF